MANLLSTLVPVGPPDLSGGAGAPVPAPPPLLARPDLLPDPSAALAPAQGEPGVLPGPIQWVQSEAGGTPIQVETEKVGNLLRQGFQLVPPEVAYKLAAAEKHKGILSALGAAGQGAVETLLPVVGPLLESPFYPLEEQRALKEAHPIATGVGMVGGAVGATLATAGLGAGPSAASAARGMGVAAAARGTAPELLASLGAKVAAGVEASAGSNALGRITAAAASQATQAAGFAAADHANRLLQGDPQANAEHLFHAGVGALLFGGALGATGGVMSEAAGAHFGDFVDSLRSLEARGGLKATGAIQVDLKRWAKNLGKDGQERLEEIGKYLGREDGVAPFKSFEEMLDAADTKFKGPAAVDMESILARADTGQRRAVANYGEVFNRAVNDPVVARWSKNPFDKAAYDSFIGELEAARAPYVTLNPDGSLAHYNQISPKGLHDLSKYAADKARGYTGQQTPSRDALHSAWDAVRISANERLDQIFREVEKSGMASGLEKAWDSAKFRYQAGIFLEEGATKGWNRSMGNNQISLGEGLGGITGALSGEGASALGGALGTAAVGMIRREGSSLQNKGARVLADWLERAQTQSGRLIGASVERIFQAGSSRAASLAAEAFADHRVSREDFPAVAKHYLQAANDPDFVAQQIAQKLGPLINGAGSTALALHGTAVAAAQHLATKIPNYEKAGPLDGDYVPTRADLAALQRHATIVHSPETVLHQIASGTYTSEDGATLDAVYPTLAPQIRQAVAEALTERLGRGEVVPSRSRLGLAQFLQMPLSSAYTPQTIASVQAAYAASAQPQAAQPPPKQVKFKSSEMLASASQRKTSLDA